VDLLVDFFGAVTKAAERRALDCSEMGPATADRAERSEGWAVRMPDASSIGSSREVVPGCCSYPSL